MRTRGLNDVGSVRQVDINKKREQELQKLRRDLEEAQIQSEQNTQSLRKKQQDAVNELSEQVDHVGKIKSKYVQKIFAMRQLHVGVKCLSENNIFIFFIAGS